MTRVAAPRGREALLQPGKWVVLSNKPLSNERLDGTKSQQDRMRLSGQGYSSASNAVYVGAADVVVEVAVAVTLQ